MSDEPRTVTVELPEPTLGPIPDFPGMAEWWPETDESPWSVTIWNGKPRIDFDGADPNPDVHTNTSLQVSPEGEHWPFISLDLQHAELLAAHLLAAIDHAKRIQS